MSNPFKKLKKEFTRAQKDLLTGGGAISADTLRGKTAADAAKKGGARLSEAALETAGIRGDAARVAANQAAAGVTAGAGIRASGLLQGANQFEDFSREGLASLEGRLSPFADAFGAEDIARLKGLSTDVNAQSDFITNNPFFEALRNKAKEDTFRTQSGSGALGSSGTDEQLQNSFLAQGQGLIDAQINRGLGLMDRSQSAATNLGIRSSGILSDIGRAQGNATSGAAGLAGDATARAMALRAQGLQGAELERAGGITDSAQAITSGNIAAGNARAAGMNNIIGLGTTALSAMTGNPFALFQGMGGQAPASPQSQLTRQPF